jgi:Ca-activated chloride channel family protein
VDPLTAAKSAAAFGIKIFAIGAGSPGETLIPVDDPRFGRQMVPIRSDLDEDTLLKVASETGGKYFRAKSEGALKSIFKEIDSMEKTDIKVKEYVDYKELYVGFLLFACFFLIIELLLSKTIFRTVP